MFSKICYSRKLLFSLVFILSHIVRFLLNIKPFYRKIYLHVTGILNQQKQILLSTDQTLFSLRIGTQTNA